ncbi:proline racemase family protein [Sneathiella glossodoripedis]|uniref:proline racemase family protein n=1 Tax=Sneathiella glossodoripedis TaxID=418853 RepID=UPI000AD41EC8|nr:proline racemase family protein [Sneathiella glossodoripedis]
MKQSIKTVEMHTGGEPLRIVTEGIENLYSGDLLATRRYLRDEADHYRRFLMFEPRGHKDMYGALIVPADHPEADFGVIFMHNEGYSTMCGHAIIALGRYAIDYGLVERTGDAVQQINIQCPCGLVQAHVEVSEEKTGSVRFESVPAFAYRLDQIVNTTEFGPVSLDIAYGGAFYGILDASSLGIDLHTSSVQQMISTASELSQAIQEQLTIEHPEEADLGYLYGIIFTDGHVGNESNPSRNVCVFADGQVDRSPTGSGVTARLALNAAKKLSKIGETHQFESLTDAVFSGKIIRQLRWAPILRLQLRLVEGPTIVDPVSSYMKRMICSLVDFY